MKGKTLLIIGILLLVTLYWVDIGAFVVTDVGEAYPGSAIAVGVSQSWANVAVWENGQGLSAMPMLVLFAIVEALFLSSHNKKGKLWKKVLVITSDVVILAFSFLQLIALFSASGKKYMFSEYLFTYGTTGTVYILYLAALSLIGGAILKLIEGFKLPKE